MLRITGLMVALSMVLSIHGLASDATVNVGSDYVDASASRVTVAVALPAGVVGKRINRAVLEVPIETGESPEALFNAFPLVEIYEEGSEAPKQTMVLGRNFAGVARFDVTRFVKAWATTDAKLFVLGAVSASNKTSFELGTTDDWASTTKARLIL